MITKKQVVHYLKALLTVHNIPAEFLNLPVHLQGETCHLGHFVDPVQKNISK